MRFLARWLRRLLLALLGLVALAAALVAGALWLTIPASEATRALPGLRAPVEITLDAQGVPRIRAGSETDAAMALGWLHARDRLFQMELMRRGASGRLSEIAGPATLRLDRFSRTLGLARRAEADLAALPPATRALLDAYAEGVNAHIRARGRFAAPEFLLLGAPEPWRPSDSLLWGKVMGLWLSGAWRTDLERGSLAALLPPERLAEIWPRDTSTGRPDQTSPAAAPGRAAGLPALIEPAAAARLLAATPSWPEDAPLPPSASNAWALAPARSASGAALLASDPHLGFQAPILWYLARIELPGGRFLAGATSPGVPFMVIGRSESLAWGFTTTHSDTQDVFLERLAANGQYDGPDGPLPFVTRQERILVRGRPAEEITIRETRHGPVISDLDDSAPPGQAIAVAMANLAPEDTAAAGLHGVNRARSVAEAREAARLITAPPQNLMLADREGHVAMVLTGRTPIRRKGDGSLPVPGWDGAHDWIGWLAFDDMPHAADPPGGALVNANNRVEPQGSPVFLGRDWYGDWRFRRIHALLGAAPRHEAAALAAMQNDAQSLFAAELLPHLAAMPRLEGRLGEAQALLAGWDGTMAIERPEPLIFNAFWREAALLIMEKSGVPRGLAPPRPEFLRFALSPEGRHWCGSGEEACAPILAEALRRAIEPLQARLGENPAHWRWGAVHQVRFEHQLLRALPWASRLIRMEGPTPGDGQTISRGSLRGGEGPEGFAHVQGAGLRLVADLASPDGLLAIIATGQSGNPLSPHWDDLFPLWREGQVLRLTAAPGALSGRISLRP